MNKNTLHFIHQKLDNVLYLNFKDKMPKELSGVVEVLEIIKKEIRDLEKDFEEIKKDSYWVLFFWVS